VHERTAFNDPALKHRRYVVNESSVAQQDSLASVQRFPLKTNNQAGDRHGPRGHRIIGKPPTKPTIVVWQQQPNSRVITSDPHWDLDSALLR
jgi:hypothetical protein